jgi:two-component system chemotaxis sensor kinase CheA
MDELLLDFVTESKEHLETIEDDFVMLVQQQDDPDPELVNKVFRAIHTVKGVAGFVGQKRIGELSHIMESLLQQIKTEKKKPEQRFIDVLLEGVDQLNLMLDRVEESNDMDISEIYEKLRILVEEGSDSQAAAPPMTSDEMEEAESEEESLPEIDLETSTEEEASEEETGEAAEPPSPVAEETSGSEEISLEEDEAPEFEVPELQVTPDMVARFTQESLDLLGEAEQGLLKIEKDPDSLDAHIGETFRMMHSFKGNCGFFGLADFEKLSQEVENVLDAMRNGRALGNKDSIGLLLRMVDFLRNGLNDYAENGKEKILGLPGMLDLLSSIEGTQEPEATDVETPPAPQEKSVTPEQVEDSSAEAAPEPQEDGRQEKKPAKAAPTSTPEKNANSASKSAAAKKTKTDAAAKAVAAARQGIRVDITKLDKLINLVGELVIAEAMVVRNPTVVEMEDENLERAIHHLNRVSADLQDVAMSVRMVPLEGTFRKMTRLVYDVSRKAGKKVDLKLEGEETEVDKTVIEQIGDPLVHIVRNAIDHGLETPDERKKAGKPEAGSVRIEARHEGGEVWIVIQDDGRGLNREKILAKAIKNGILTEDAIPEMRDEAIYKLIFEPGFSTAEKVTDISGRGVGMDVVKKNIEKLKGRVEVRSNPGQGSTFILHIPLTLAIIDGMLIRVGDARYTIPLLTIRETLRPKREQITITPDGRETARVREEMIPVLRLHDIFKKKSQSERLEDGLLIIVEFDRQFVALFVDELLGQHQTVIKGLSDYLGEARGVSGCTILGDGEVSLILDIGGLIEMTNTKQRP